MKTNQQQEQGRRRRCKSSLVSSSQLSSIEFGLRGSSGRSCVSESFSTMPLSSRRKDNARPLSVSLHGDPSGLSSSSSIATTPAASRRGGADRRSRSSRRLIKETADDDTDSSSNIKPRTATTTTQNRRSPVRSPVRSPRRSSVSRNSGSSTTRRSMPKKAKSERRIATSLLVADNDISKSNSGRPPAAHSPKLRRKQSQRAVTAARDSCSSLSSSSSSRRSKSLRNVNKAFVDDLSCTRHNNNISCGGRKIKRRSDTTNDDSVPGRLMTALGRSVRATPSGKIQELALSMMLDDGDIDGDNSSSELGAREEDTIAHLLANPAMIPLNIRW